MRSVGHRIARLEAEVEAIRLRRSSGAIHIPAAMQMDPREHLHLTMQILLSARVPDGRRIPDELKARMEAEIATWRLLKSGKSDSSTSKDMNQKRKKAAK